MTRSRSGVVVAGLGLLALTLASCSDTDGPTEPAGPQFGDMAGVVTDLFGAPIEGATVTATPSSGFPATTTTDASGIFAYAGIETGSYVVSAEKSGFEEAMANATVNTNSPANVQMQLEPLSLPSSGTVGSRVVGYSGSTMTFEVDIFVVDASATPVSGLSPSSFAINNFTGFSFGQQSVSQSSNGSLGPYSAALLLDQSGSIRSTDPNDSRVQAAKIFLSAVGGGDNVVVSAFASGGSLPHDPLTVWGSFTGNGPSFYSVVDQLPSMESGGTPLYQSAAGMVDYTWQNAPTSNRAVVIFTDGEDTQGGWTIDQVISHANQRGVRLYTVGLSSSVNTQVLSRLATETGGTVMWAGDARQLVSLYKTLGGVLRGSVSFYRTRWTATLTNGQRWGTGGWLQSGVSIATSAGTVWTPFYVEIK